jgi:hypothetical protein
MCDPHSTSDLGFANAGAMQFPDFRRMQGCRCRPTQPFPVLPRMGQFVQVHVDPPLHRHIWVRCSRKRGVKGRPRISLIGRLGLLPDAAQADKPETGESAPAGHGRNGAAAFSGANKVTVAHATLHSGDLCPECLRGKARTDAASASGSATARCRQSRSGSPAGVAPICSFAKWPSMTFSAALMRTNRKFLIEKCEADGRGSD